MSCTMRPNIETKRRYASHAKRGFFVNFSRAARLSSLRPRLRTVSIIPGIDIAAPERTDTSNGFLGSPSFLPVDFSTRASACSTCSQSPGGNFLPDAKYALHASVVIVKPGGTGSPACVDPAVSRTTPPVATPAIAATSTRAVVLSCEPTRKTDAAGVVTADGGFGIVGEASTYGGDTEGAFWLVRKGAALGDSIALHFEQTAGRAPATWVEYNATGSPRTTPWGDVAFKVGWKPISFSDSCWRLVVDGTDTGLVVAVGH